MADYKVVVGTINLLDNIDKKQKNLEKAKKEVYNLSIKNIPTRKKFMKRLQKINSKFSLFAADELERYTDWLFTLKYERDYDRLYSKLYYYSEKEIEYFCTEERIDFIDKVKVVKRLTK